MAGGVRGLAVWAAAVAAGGLAVLALTGLWSGAMADRFMPGAGDQLSRAYYTAAREARISALTVQRIRWSRALRAHSDPGSLAVLGENVPVRDSARETVALALAGLANPGAVEVGVVTLLWQRPDDGTRFVPRGGGYGIDYLMPDDGPCQVAIFVPGGATTPYVLRTLLEPGRIPGPCAWVARYGRPGDSIRAWFRQGGSVMASASTPSSPPDRPHTPDRLNRLERSCLQGRADACAAILEGPPTGGGELYAGPGPGDPLLHTTGAYARRSLFRGYGEHLLADMERAMGTDAFARFWQSDRPVPDALAEALGEPVGPWIARWARARFGVPRRDGGGLVDFLLAGLVVAALAGVAVVTDRLRNTSY